MVQRWDIITIGNLSRNRFWGEGDEAPRRLAICTCTLLRLRYSRILVDPSLADGERMAAELERRTGLRPDEVTAVFITHAHDDHHYGLKHFLHARWFAALDVAAAINAEAIYPKCVEPVEAWEFSGIELIATPGHTRDHHSLRFHCDGLSVVVAGDAVMTRDYWDAQQGHYNSVDAEQASRTIRELASAADVIVPGHDNYFLTRRRPAA